MQVGYQVGRMRPDAEKPKGLPIQHSFHGPLSQHRSKFGSLHISYRTPKSQSSESLVEYAHVEAGKRGGR